MIPAVAKLKRELPVPAARNSVRIIGGIWRGRRVHFPDMPALRPTPDRVRETLFNWLQHSLVGTRCLDLFAGSGALGLEALSRGAAEVVFVEQFPAASRFLQEQLARFRGEQMGPTGQGRVMGTAGVVGKGSVMEMGAARFLRTSPMPFDIAFLDPPFGQDALAEYIPMLDAGNWLKVGGLVYLENERIAGVPKLPAHWELLKSKSAGEVGYHLARVNGRI
jgi:16S rRNA (guanine966-N2)-methyltransferase